MRIKPGLKHTKSLAAYVFVLAAFLLLDHTPIQAQTYWLRYSMIVGSTDSVTQNNVYDSGKVQSTNVLMANLVGPGGVASAYATPSASFGLLQLSAGCSANNPYPGTYGNGHGSRFFSYPGLQFQDALTPTSATLPPGTPVQIQIACVYSGYITPGAPGYSDYTDSTASVGISGSAFTSAIGAIGGSYQTNFISVIANSTIGSSFYFIPSLAATGDASDGDGAAFVGSVTTSITSQTYVTVLTPGAGYTAASGTIYPTLPSSTLSIQATTNQNVVLSWPSQYVNYALQQNPTLGTTNWVWNTNNVSQTNGTNQVIVASTANQMFFRLSVH